MPNKFVFDPSPVLAGVGHFWGSSIEKQAHMHTVICTPAYHANLNKVQQLISRSTSLFMLVHHLSSQLARNLIS